MRNPKNVVALIAVFPACVFLNWSHVNAANTKVLSEPLHETRVPPSNDPLVAECDYSLWIPEDTPIVKSFFIINMRAAGKHLFYKDLEWRALAAKNSSAMLYCKFEAHSVRDNGYGLSILAACEQFADELDRPELKHAPFVFWGHSMGGRVAQDFVRFRPSRVLAFHIGLRGNPSSEEFMQEESAAMRVPGLYLMGEEDKKPRDIREHFHRARKQGSPRAWIWLPGQEHWPEGMSFRKDNTTPADWRAWAANDIVIPWTDNMIKLRLPKNADPREGPVKLLEISSMKGWLGDIQSGQISPHHEFLGSKSDASWFPSKSVAKAWVGFAFERTTPFTSNTENEKSSDQAGADNTAQPK